MTPDFIRNAYRVLLSREIDEGQLEPIISEQITPEHLVASILNSEEFLHGPVAKYAEWGDPRSIRYKALDKLCALFKRYDGPGAAGFYIDFLGVKTRLHYIPNVEQYDGSVFDYPSRKPQPLEFDPAEWEGTLRSVIEAKDSFVAIELGSGYGPWLVASAAAAKQRGIQQIQLAGIEGSADHFAFLLQHFRDNGLDPADHFLFHGIVGATDGMSYFPKLADPKQDWGAQAVPMVRWFFKKQMIPAPNDRFVDYRGIAFDALEKVPSLSLTTLLQKYPHVNLIHCDIQDSEGEVIPSAADELDKRARRLVVGTHSRRSEAAILDALSARGWLLEHDVPCRYVVANNRVLTINDGVQVWANPHFSQTSSTPMNTDRVFASFLGRLRRWWRPAPPSRSQG